MKKKLLFGCMLSSLFSLAQVANPVPLKMKHVDMLKDYAEIMQTRSTELLLPGFKETYYYNNGYQLDSRNEYTYVQSNRIATDVSSYFDGTALQLDSRRTYTYSATYEVILNEWWNSTDEIWENSWVDSTFFDAQGNMIKQVGYGYDQSLEAWEFQWGEIRTLSYSANNELLSVTYAGYTESGPGTPYSRELWTWTGGNGPSSGIFQDWDENTSTWVDEARATGITWFDFSEFMLTAATVEFKDEDTWEFAFQIEASYFANGVQQLYIERNWDGTQFVNGYKNEQTIDANGQRTSSLDFYWDADAWELEYGQQFTNTYAANEALLQVDEAQYDFFSETFNPDRRFVYGNHINIAALNENKILMATVYPNPVNDQLNLVLENETASFEILNLAGQSLISGQASGMTNIDVRSLAQGMYVLKISNGQQANAIKFLKN